MTEIDPAALITQLIPPVFLAEGIKAIDQSGQTFASNHDRREWAWQFLQTHLHTPEWLSRFIVEAAIAWIKTRQAAGERS